MMSRLWQWITSLLGRGGGHARRENAAGKYRGLSGASAPPAGASERLVLVFIPSLVAILRNRELKKGAPLTEEEVLSLRDNGKCVAMTPAMARDLAESRGYEDVNAEDVWNEWQAARADFEDADESHGN